MEKQYSSPQCEKDMQELWQTQQTYSMAHNPGPLYSIDTPPPTVSGSLHIGHIFSYTQTDIIARYKRMNGYSVFYPFGFDDNGLPTERYVEKKQAPVLMTWAVLNLLNCVCKKHMKLKHNLKIYGNAWAFQWIGTIVIQLSLNMYAKFLKNHLFNCIKKVISTAKMNRRSIAQPAALQLHKQNLMTRKSHPPLMILFLKIIMAMILLLPPRAQNCCLHVTLFFITLMIFAISI